MANTDNRKGLYPRKMKGNGDIVIASYTIASGESTGIFQGDPVKSTGTGKGIVAAAAGDTMVGVFTGCEYIDSAGSPQHGNFWPASTVATDIIAYVYDDPDILFGIQVDEDLVAADIGATADLVATAAGSTSTGLSGFELDSSDIGTGAGVKIYDIVQSVDNAYGTAADALVFINEHENRSTMTGV